MVGQEKNSNGKELLVEIAYKLLDDKSATIKVFKDDDPHDLAVRFCEKHYPPDKVKSYLNGYEKDIKKKIQALDKDGISELSITTLYRGLGLPKSAL